MTSLECEFQKRFSTRDKIAKGILRSVVLFILTALAYARLMFFILTALAYARLMFDYILKLELNSFFVCSISALPFAPDNGNSQLFLFVEF